MSTAGLLDLNTIPEYVWTLFNSFCGQIKTKESEGTLWINLNELGKAEYRDIKVALFGEGKLFDLMGIDKELIPSVQQYRWKIEGVEYEKLKNLLISKYIVSTKHRYVVDGVGEISFYFRCYGRYSDDNPQCAIFLKFDGIPDNLKRLRIEVDIKCVKKREFRQLLKTQILTKEHNYCGFQAFEFEELNRNECIEWVLRRNICGLDPSSPWK